MTILDFFPGILRDSQRFVTKQNSTTSSEAIFQQHRIVLGVSATIKGSKIKRLHFLCGYSDFFAEALYGSQGSLGERSRNSS